MKKPSITLNFSKLTRISRSIGVMSRMFFILAALTFCLFILISLAGYAGSKWNSSSVSSMKGLAAGVSSQFFVDMIAMEIPQLSDSDNLSAFSSKKVSGFIFRFLTNINPSDPKTLLAIVVPGLNRENTFILRKGAATDLTAYPIDYTPPAGALLPDPLVFHQKLSKQQDSGKTPDEISPVGSVAPNDSGSQKDTVSPGTSTQQASVPAAPVLSTKGKKVAFIYHSHNRESWVPELKNKGVKDLNDAFDSKTNITLLGKRLAKELEDLGIGTVNSEKDYPTVVKNYNWNFSYKYSLKTVQEAFAVNPQLEYYFDIHRDSQKRKWTTAKINGKNYAQVYFIIGHKNPKWEKNEAFAKKIHDLLEKRYPGISRGIWSKSSNSGHAEYNQSFSPNSILIEVGGPENTLQESFQTIDVLAKAIADIYWEAERVDAPLQRADKQVSDEKSQTDRKS